MSSCSSSFPSLPWICDQILGRLVRRLESHSFSFPSLPQHEISFERMLWVGEGEERRMPCLSRLFSRERQGENSQSCFLSFPPSGCNLQLANGYSLEDKGKGKGKVRSSSLLSLPPPNIGWQREKTRKVEGVHLDMVRLSLPGEPSRYSQKTVND